MHCLKMAETCRSYLCCSGPLQGVSNNGSFNEALLRTYVLCSFIGSECTCSANLFSHTRRAAVVRTDASANLALSWEIEESVVSSFHGEALLNLEKGRCFRLAWPTGRAAVGNGTSTGMVGIGKDTVENCWLPTKSVSFKSQESN